MKNNNLKNLIKSAIALSVHENKEVVPFLQKAYQLIEINENKIKQKLKNKKEQIQNNNSEFAKNNIKMIDELIKKESEILNKKTNSSNQTQFTNNQDMLLD